MSVGRLMKFKFHKKYFYKDFVSLHISSIFIKYKWRFTKKSHKKVYRIEPRIYFFGEMNGLFLPALWQLGTVNKWKEVHETLKMILSAWHTVKTILLLMKTWIS